VRNVFYRAVLCLIAIGVWAAQASAQSAVNPWNNSSGPDVVQGVTDAAANTADLNYKMDGMYDAVVQSYFVVNGHTTYIQGVYTYAAIMAFAVVFWIGWSVTGDLLSTSRPGLWGGGSKG